MSDVVLTNQGVTVPTLTGDLRGFASVVCLGDARVLASFYEVGGNHMFRSEDDGVTWSQLADPVATAGLSGKMIPLSPDEVLIGGEGSASADPIYRTTDGGDTWTAVNTSAVINASDDFFIRSFVNIGNDEILALGVFTSGGVNGTGNYGYHMMRSADAGLTWTTQISMPVTPLEVDDPGALYSLERGAYCGNDVVVVAGATVTSVLNRGPVVYRSTDRGVNWTQITLPTNVVPGDFFCGPFAVTDVVYLGADVVLATGYYQPGGVDPGDDRNLRLWRSEDAGLTWTETTDDVTGYTIQDQVEPSILQDLGNGYVLLAFWCRPATVGDSGWRLSTDYGVNWTIPTTGPYTNNTTTNPVNMHDMTVSGGGFVIASLKGGVTDADNEIWRGVADDFTPLSVCDCTGAPPPPGSPPPATPGRPALCAGFSGEGCVTPEPIDPSVTVLGINLVPGFQSPLFFLGIGAGSGLDPAVMTRPTACQTFISAYCDAPVN